MASRTPKRRQAPRFDPIPMFDLDAYCTEYPPSVKRIRAIQVAAAAEAGDQAIPIAARRHNLTRMQRWLATLLSKLDDEGDDHDHRSREYPARDRPG